MIESIRALSIGICLLFVMGSAAAEEGLANTAVRQIRSEASPEPMARRKGAKKKKKGKQARKKKKKAPDLESVGDSSVARHRLSRGRAKRS
ncbi:MAG: hypothetical protein R3C68_14825 [Myxococcota bacterium]